MTLLRLYLTETWPSDPACDWAVIGPEGRPTAEGHSDPRHWPGADSCEFVLAGAQALWLTARVPRAPRREQDRLVRFALEEHLVQEPDSQHFTITDREEEQLKVLVVARERLAQIQAQLAALGRMPLRAWAELETIAVAAEGWTLTRAANHGIVTASDMQAFALDLEGGAPPPALVAALAHARVGNRLPACLVVRSSHDAPPLDLAAWSEVLGLPCEAGEPYRWSAFNGRSNLLEGEFMPAQKRGRLLRQIRPALWLMAAVVLIQFVQTEGRLLWQRHQVAQAREAMQGVFRTAFPNQPIVDVGAQFRAQLAQLRHAHGQVADDDLLSMLATASDALGGDAQEALEAFRFEDGRLELTLAPRAAINLGPITERLKAHGLQVGKLTDNKLALRRDTSQ